MGKRKSRKRTRRTYASASQLMGVVGAVEALYGVENLGSLATGLNRAANAYMEQIRVMGLPHRGIKGAIAALAIGKGISMVGNYAAPQARLPVTRRFGIKI